MNEKSKKAIERLHSLWSKIESAQRSVEWERKNREEYRAKLYTAHASFLKYEKELCELRLEAADLEALFEIKE
jgi:hypothetical protein